MNDEPEYSNDPKEFDETPLFFGDAETSSEDQYETHDSYPSDYEADAEPAGDSEFVIPFASNDAPANATATADDVPQMPLYEAPSYVPPTYPTNSDTPVGYEDTGVYARGSYTVDEEKDHDTNFMRTSFEERIDNLDISESRKKELRQKNLELLDLYYYPAMEMLIEKLPELKGKCNDKTFLAATDEGKAYYEALFRSKTGVDMSVEECTELLQQKIDEIYDEYMPQWKKKGSYFAFGDLDFDQATEWCRRFTEENLPEVSDHDVEVYEIPRQLYDSIQPARYYPSPIDNFTQHTVWLNVAMLDDPNYDMFTLVSHEMYPGHLYQHQYQAENLESRYQVFAMSEPYAEGWAQYSEKLMLSYQGDLGYFILPGI